MDDLCMHLNRFDPVSLSEMDSVKLMERVDTKFVFPAEALPGILETLVPHYRVLQIDDRRISRYETIYFDTPGLSLYLWHHNGKQDRYKVRFRGYSDTSSAFFEIKHRNNKGRTLKSRIPAEGVPERISGEAEQFLHRMTPLHARDLVPVLRVRYSRITLVSRTGCERVTIDTALQTEARGGTASFAGIVIAEAKQDHASASAFREVMQAHRFFDGSVSKYCLGITALYPVKKNRFKEKYRPIHLLTRSLHA